MKNIFSNVIFLGFLVFGFIEQTFTQSVTATADPYYICFGGSSQLDANPSGITGSLTYSWSPTTGLNDPAISNPIASNLTETVIYTVEVTGNEGAFSDTTKVTVYDELIASIYSDQSICYNTTPDQLTSTVSGGDGTYTYQWQDSPDGIVWTDISGATSDTLQPLSLLGTKYYHLIVDDEICPQIITDSVTITVYDELLASVSTVQPTCYNTAPDSLTSTVSGGDGSYTYQWFVYDGSNWTIIPSATNPIYQPGILLISTDYQLAVDDGSNCGPVITNTVTITVYDELLASITADQTICYNTAPDPLTSAVSGGEGTYTYQWQIFTGTWEDLPGETNPTYQPDALTSTTDYRLEVDDGADCGPVTSNTVTITVYDELIATTGIDQTICYNDTPQELTSTPSGGEGTYTYQWQVFTGTWEDLPGETNPTYQPDALTSTTDYRLEVNDGADCGPVTSNTTTITVYSEYEVGEITGGNSPICYGDNGGTLQANPANGSGNYTITWYDGDNSQVGTGETYAIGLLTETSSFYYNAVDDEECGDENSDPITIAVFPEFEIGTISGGNTPICYGDDAGTIEASPTNGSGSYTITWYDGDNNQVGTGETYAIGPLIETTSFYYNAIDNVGCGDENSTEVTINVNPMIDAAVSITVSKNPTCDNEEVLFTISDTINGGNNPNFEWFLNGESKSTENTWTSLVSDNDEVMAQMMSNAACLNDNPVISNQISMTVNASPVLLNSGDLVPKPLDNPVVLICVDSMETNTYSWFEDGVEIPAANEQFYYPSKYNHTFNYNSEYYMMIENEFCSANTNTYTYVFNKSALFEDSDIFTIYPNPSNGEFSIVLNEDFLPEDFESCQIKIFDAKGKVVFKEDNFTTEQKMQLMDFQNGLFLIQIDIPGTQRQVKKLIVN